MSEGVTKRADGTYEEKLGGKWLAIYTEAPQNGLWEVEVFKHDVAEWYSTEFASLEDARQAAQNFYDQA